MNSPHDSCQRGGFRNVCTIMQSERRADLAGAKCNLFGPFCACRAAASPRVKRDLVRVNCCCRLETVRLQSAMFGKREDHHFFNLFFYLYNFFSQMI